MATREYIGARYVPKFYQNSVDGSTQWQPNVVYEPLMWVTLTNGHMYISKKQVPATVGTPAENIDYWLDIGSYNGIIQDLQDQIDAIAQDLSDAEDELQSNIDTVANNLTSTAQTLQGQITANANNISGLEDDITAVNTRITNTANSLQANVDKKQFNDKNRKYLFLGDSYYLGGQGTSYTGIGWATQVINFLGLSSSQYILTPASDLTPQGTVTLPGFYPTESGHLSFKSILENCASHLTTEQKNSVTDIVVAGGYNDRDKGTAIWTGMGQYVTYAKTTFPNAKLWCAHIGWSRSASDRAKLIYTQRAYRRAIQYGMTYIDDAEFVLPQDSLFISDGVHPTETGYKQIGAAIANALVAGNDTYSAHSYYVNGGPINDATVVSHSGGFYMYLNEYGKKTFGSSAAMILNLNTAYPINSSTPLQFVLDCDGLQVTESSALQFPMMIQLAGGTITGLKYVHGVVSFVQDNSSKRLRIDFQEDPGVTASIIGIAPFSFTAPACFI